MSFLMNEDGTSKSREVFVRKYYELQSEKDLIRNLIDIINWRYIENSKAMRETLLKIEKKIFEYIYLETKFKGDDSYFKDYKIR